MSEVPAWVHEPPEIRPHDPRLIRMAAEQRDRLAVLLAPWLADGLEHVGSTSVPGLAAKPVIDLMASVTDPALLVAEATGRLAADGWHFVPPELDQRPWRRFYIKPDASGRRRLAHLHVIRAGHPRWAQQLAFRDALRRDARLARRYEDLKRDLVARHAGDREAYSLAKGEFVLDALKHLPGGSPAS